VNQRAGLGRDRLVPVLSELLKNDDSHVAAMACQCLAAVGPTAKVAVPALVEALKHDDAKVREEAAKALKQIDPQAADGAGVGDDL
jgi:HEAT repeat protein